MAKQILIILIVTATGVIIWGCSADISGSGGEISDCTKDLSYIQITDADGLKNIANDLSADYCLANNIDASSITSPIGYPATDITPTNNPYPDDNKFTGNFDGNNNWVSNLTINKPTALYIGLFGYAGGGGTVKNLTIHNPQITGKQYVGALVGYNNGKDIENVHITADDKTTVRVTGSTGVGGLLGYALSSKTINFSITDSSAEVAVKGTEGVIGGLIGGTLSSLVTVENSYATGDVSGTDYVGGLVGENSTAALIKNGYATGSVTGTTSVGGLVGSNNALIENSYATGSVTGTTSVGGLVGRTNSNTGKITNSYFDTATTGQQNGVGTIDQTGVTGYSSPPTQQSTFSGWDFSAIWKWIGNGKWPELAWQ